MLGRRVQYWIELVLPQSTVLDLDDQKRYGVEAKSNNSGNNMNVHAKKKIADGESAADVQKAGVLAAPVQKADDAVVQRAQTTGPAAAFAYWKRQVAHFPWNRCSQERG